MRLTQAALPVWLTVASFAVQVRPELLALSALAVAIAVKLPDVAEGRIARPAEWIGAFAAVTGAGAAIWVGHAMVSASDRIPLLQPPSLGTLVAGAWLIVATMYLVVRSLGIAVALIVLALLLYALLGHLIGGAAGHGLIRPSHFIDLMCFTTDGLLGAPLAVATGTVVHFLIFAAVLERTGATLLFCRLAERLCGGGRGSTAKVAVASSAFFGTISGSPTSDVVATGSMTIPAMRSAGYPATKAAAIEVSASTGGSILPPVMGTAAFILAEYTGTAYSTVLIAAVLPGLLYYGALYLSITLDARRNGYKALETAPAAAHRNADYLQLALPAATLVWVILLGYPPGFAAAAGTVVALVASLFGARGPLRPADIAEALVSTGRRLIPVVAACAAAGLIIGAVTMSGLSGKAAALLLSLTGGELFPTLVAAATGGLLLGLGMPTTSAYILGAMLLAPALVDAGTPLLAAHLFVLYFAVLSAMTPPVAVAAFAAASISGGSPYRIGLTAIRFSVAAFVLPFAFVAHPGLLMAADPLSILIAGLRASLALAAIVIAIEGMAREPLPIPERVGAAAAGLLLLTPQAATASFGFVFLMLLLARHLSMWSRWRGLLRSGGERCE